MTAGIPGLLAYALLLITFCFVIVQALGRPQSTQRRAADRDIVRRAGQRGQQPHQLRRDTYGDGDMAADGDGRSAGRAAISFARSGPGASKRLALGLRRRAVRGHRRGHMADQRPPSAGRHRRARLICMPRPADWARPRLLQTGRQRIGRSNRRTNSCAARHIGSVPSPIPPGAPDCWRRAEDALQAARQLRPLDPLVWLNTAQFYTSAARRFGSDTDSLAAEAFDRA